MLTDWRGMFCKTNTSDITSLSNRDYGVLVQSNTNKNDVKCQNTLGCLDQYTCKVLRLWNSRERETVWVYKYAQMMETMTQSGLWSNLGTHGSLVVIWWLCISSSGEARKFDILSQIWLWRSIAPQNYRDLNQCILHLWSKFGDPSVNGWWVMCGQAQNRVNFAFKLNLTLKVKVDCPLKQ